MITLEQRDEFEKHAIAHYPEEVCAVIAGGNLILCQNEAEDRNSTFKISAEKLIEAEILHGPLDLVLHTHSGASAGRWPRHWPSGQDMQSWMHGSTPWLIFACNGEGLGEHCVLDDANPAPLEGREFIHGINDCYSLIRDYFRMEKGITLPNYPRDMEWWAKDKDLYSENFEAAGFVEIPADQVRSGDCMMIQFRSDVINHAAVVIDESRILHHMIHRLSGYDDWSKWHRVAAKYVRYVGEKQ
jgi:proteasome lid subunit RPN8/RPN11